MCETYKLIQRKYFSSPKQGDLRVYHIPQIPMKAFYVPVSSPEEALKVMDMLAYYDAFQFSHNIKPDYSNVSGLEVYDIDSDGERNSGWTEWYDKDGYNIDEHFENLKDKDE